MNCALRRILVVGGNGFIGSAVCKAAVARGIQAVSVSSSGKPYGTAKGHTPAWVNKVVWEKGDALHPESFSHLFPGVCGVVHTLGTLFEGPSGAYKHAVRSGDVPRLLSSFFQSIATRGEGGNPLEKHTPEKRGVTYETINRDSALRVCEAFMSSMSRNSAVSNVPRPFVYISAEDIFRPVIPARYIETKREAERSIEEMMVVNTDYRGVYIRPSLVYHAHERPLTTPAAVLFDLSATLHAKASRSLPTPSSILRSVGSLFPHGENQAGTGVGAAASKVSGAESFSPATMGTKLSGSTNSGATASSVLESVANALETPPIHVDHVADAIMVALDSRSGIRGVVGVRRMRELIGWRGNGQSSSMDAKEAGIGPGS